jgi:hypothetical protein
MLAEALLKIPLRCLHYPALRAVNRPQNLFSHRRFLVCIIQGQNQHLIIYEECN